MNGCNIRTIPRKTMTSVERAAVTTVASALCKPALDNSIYQEQKSSHTKLYNSLPTNANSYFSMFSVTFSNTSLKRFKIHLSIIDALLTSISSKWNASPNCISAKRLAFQILLIKFQLASTFSSE